MSKKQEQLHEEVKRFIVNVSWTHKIHIAHSDLLASYAMAIRIANLVLSAVVSSGLIYILLTDTYWAKLLTAICSLLVTLSVAFRKEFNFDELSSKEKADVNVFWGLREEASRLLYSLTYNTEPSAEVSEKFNRLLEIRSERSLGLLTPSQKAVDKAGKLLKNRRDDDYTEDFKYLIPANLMEIKEKE